MCVCVLRPCFTEAFRAAREACGGVDAFVRLTSAAANRALSDELRRRGQLHPGVDWTRMTTHPAETGAGAGAGAGEHDGDGGASVVARDPAAAVLSRYCHVAAVAMLPPDAAANPVMLPLVRELLAGSVLRPLLGFASPPWRGGAS